jgi:hypothetical protein
MKPHEVASMTLTYKPPQTDSHPNKNVVIYKQGVPDTQDYSDLPSNIKKTKKSAPHIIEENFTPMYEIAKIDSNTSMMKHSKLKNILKSFCEYPEKYRLLIWRFLLSLPLNKSSYESYVKRGVHPAFRNLDERFPVKSSHLFNKLVRLLSALAYWCPIFAEISYLPSVVFPFVKTIQNDDLVLFEIVVSFFSQHCQLWFECYPSDPVHLLKTSVEVVLRKESPALYNHLQANGFTVSQYAWPLLQSCFADSLPKKDWTTLMDHLLTFSDDPSLLYYFLAAYLLHF